MKRDYAVAGAFALAAVALVWNEREPATLPPLIAPPLCGPIEQTIVSFAYTDEHPRRYTDCSSWEPR